jgi:hypothetical protein
MNNFLFLGWHRAEARGSHKLQQWLSERKKAVKDALRTIPGGNNVFQMMDTNGWLDFGPQVTLAPQIRSNQTKIIALHDLQHYDACVLFLYKQQPGSFEYATGLVDSKLQVRPFMVRTPIVQYAGIITNDPCKYMWKNHTANTQELQRLQRSIRNNCQINLSVRHPDIRLCLIQNLCGECFAAKFYSEPIVFNHKNKRYLGPIARFQDVRIIFSISYVTVQESSYDFYPHSVEIRTRLEQIQTQPIRCMFDEKYDEDEEYFIK